MVAFFTTHARHEQEPSFEGQALSQWLADLNFSGDLRDTKAREAIAQMGTNVLPRLGPMLRARDSDLKRGFIGHECRGPRSGSFDAWESPGAASAAVDRLNDCTSDSDERVRKNARQALKMIR